MGISVYWDQTGGSDGNDGLSPESAKESFAAAWALISPSSDDTLWIVGNVTHTGSDSIGINKNGISDSRRLTVRGFCPDGVTRPTILSTATAYVFSLQGDPHAVDYTCLKDLIIDGFDTGEGGIRVYTTGGGMLFDNLVLKRLRANAISFSGGGPDRNLNIPCRAYRCSIYDNDRTVGGPHIQATYAEYSENITFEECVFDHNGRLAADDSGTMFNHNQYLSSSSAIITTTGCISARASATGLQHRCNEHHSIGNLIIDCPLGITFGHDDYAGSFPTRAVSGSMVNNLAYGATDISAGEPREGPAFAFGLADGLTITGNIAAHAPGAATAAFKTDRASLNVTGSGNYVYNWGAAAYEVAGTADPDEPTVDFDAPITSHVFPTLSDYLTSCGVTPGVDPTDTFMQLARANNSLAWDTRWTSAAVNAYARSAIVDPPPDPGDPPQPIIVNDALFHDRRPHVITIPFGANYGDNVQGLDPTWLTDPATRIAGARTTAKRCGAPFIWMHMPAGSLASPDNYCASTDGVLPAGVLSYFTSTFKPQPLTGGAGEHERWYIYHGRLMPVNGQQNSQVTSPDDRPGTTTADATFTATAIDLFGMRGYWGNGVDYSSDDVEYAEEIRATALWSKEVWCEALPLLASPWRVDTSKIELAPYLALDSYIETRDPSNTFRFNKRTTKVVYFLDVALRATTSYVDSIIQRGIIPGVVHGVTPDATQEYIKSRYTARVPNQGTSAAL